MTAPESAPLLAKKAKESDLLPWFQVFVLLLAQLCEPIASQSIYSYINQLIGELDVIGGDQRKIGYYAGLIESLFFVVQASTVLQWSRLSDHIGRKPVLLMGLFGLTFSMLSFGLSRTFLTLVISRCLCGLLNGNVGVIKLTVAELTSPTNRALVYAWMSVVWNFGATLGPVMGGSLAKPVDRFPHVFRSRFWKTYPYFLPCLASAMVILFLAIIVLVFFEETMPKKPAHEATQATQKANDPPLTLRQQLVYPVVLTIANYALMVLLNTSVYALVPLFFSMPLKFGGLGFKPVTIGYAMGGCGFLSDIFQVVFFSRLVRYFGERRMVVNGITSLALVFLDLSLVSFVVQREGEVTRMVWVCLALLPALWINATMAFGCIFVYVNGSAPSRRSLGTTYGLVQMAGSIARAISPVMAMSLFSLSVERNLLGGYAVYMVLFVLSCFGISVALCLPGEVWPEAENDS